MTNAFVHNVHEFAKALYDEFTTITRQDDDEAISVLKDRNSFYGALASELVYEIHDGDLLPRDDIYRMVHETLGDISDQEVEDASDLELEGDIYTSDLMDYMRDNKERVEEAIQAIGIDGGLDAAIAFAQVEHKMEIASQIIHFIEDQMDDPEFYEGDDED